MVFIIYYVYIRQFSGHKFGLKVGRTCSSILSNDIARYTFMSGDYWCLKGKSANNIPEFLRFTV